MVTVLASAQTQTESKEYEPREGQPGKDVIWLPSEQAVVDTMLDLAKVTAQDYLIDLGSGDGRTVIGAAKRGARALGIEYNPDLVELSKRHAAKEGVSDKVQFVAADIFESDFSKATVITMFLLPDLNLRLRPQLLELKPGTRIVSNTCNLGDWEADETATVQGQCATYCTALLWIVPAKVEGAWKLPQGQLTLKQTFQNLSGMLTHRGKGTPITDGRVMGDQVRFSVGRVQYTGQVRGQAMQGVATARGGSRRSLWSAVRSG